MIRSLLSLCFVFFLVSCTPTSTSLPPETVVVSTPVPPLSPVEQFLDVDGVQYMRMDGNYEWESVRPFLEYFTKPVSIALRAEERIPSEVADWVEKLPTSMGMDEVLQRGTSTAVHSRGGYISKTALERQPDADGVIWNLPGNEFDLRTELNRLPKETALMFRVTLNAPWIVEESKATASRLVPEAAMAIQQVETLITMSGVPLQAFLKGIQGGLSFALCLNPEETWSLPIPGGLQIPQVGVVLMIDDVNGTLHRTLQQVIRVQLPESLQLTEHTISDVKVHKLLGIPSPIRLIPQLTHHNGRLILTTDDLWMEQVIANAEGTTPSPLLAQLEGIEDTRAQQAWVIGENLGTLSKDIQQNIMDQILAEAGEDIPADLLNGAMTDLTGFYPHVGLCYQGETLSTSVMLHKRPMPQGTAGAQSVIAAPAIVGLMAAIAVPAFAKARENAQEVKCRHNLMMIEAAKHAWATEHGKSGSDTPTWEDLMPYLTEKPVCPLGGTYLIGNMNEVPSSSILGPLR